MKTSDDVVLTARQARFIDEYLIDGNATQAAIRSGYSESNAAQSGYENMIKPYIKKQIEKGQKEIAERNRLTVDDLIKELEEARGIGSQEGVASAMVAATMGKAKILGLLVDKSEVKSEGSISIDISFK